MNTNIFDTQTFCSSICRPTAHKMLNWNLLCLTPMIAAWYKRDWALPVLPALKISNHRSITISYITVIKLFFLNWQMKRQRHVVSSLSAVVFFWNCPQRKRSSIRKLSGKYIHCCPLHLYKYKGGWSHCLRFSEIQVCISQIVFLLVA